LIFDGGEVQLNRGVTILSSRKEEAKEKRRKDQNKHSYRTKICQYVR